MHGLIALRHILDSGRCAALKYGYRCPATNGSTTVWNLYCRFQRKFCEPRRGPMELEDSIWHTKYLKRSNQQIGYVYLQTEHEPYPLA